jgi:uracil-DNA glycosylase
MKFKDIIEEETKKDYFRSLQEFIDDEYENKIIYPKKENIYNAFNYTDYDDVKVVILGQDPYHGENEAHGLSFSVKEHIKIPPSLKNIFKELNLDLGMYIPDNGCLIKWAKQGVLLLNSVLTVEKDKPGSHRNKGWEIFTDNVIKKLNERDKPIVFILWGNYAKDKEKLITNTNHLKLISPHPSPFSARNGFFGCKHFSKTNEFLKQNNIKTIDFQIDNISEKQLDMF